MSKFVITRWNGRILTAQFAGKEAVELGLEEESSILGNIYIGKVKNIVKNLNSAFVDFGDGRTGYYSMTDNPVSLFADGRRGALKCGDEIIVQVAKEAVKTKDPVLTGNLNFTGKYAVLTAGKTQIGFSSKIGDREWKDKLRPELEALTGGEVGLIVRTNAYGQEQALLREVGALLEVCRGVIGAAGYRTCFSLLYEAEPEYLKSIRGCPAGSLEEIVTDDQDVYRNLESYLKLYELDHSGPGGQSRQIGPGGQSGQNEPGRQSGSGEQSRQSGPGRQSRQGSMLRFYEDPMLSLSSLYSLETVMDQACQRRVWLKSGGYLVIEYTEAMTVIDVNTGKYSGRKNQEDTIRMINLEAAKEICRQLRLRNLSGIIMVDFIDMREDADKALLMETLRGLALKDPVKTNIVDMTGLNLVEITRKKEKKPLWEQLHKAEKEK